MEPLKILVFIVRCAKTCESVGSEHKCVSFQVTDVDSSEAKDVGDVPVSLGAKLDQYHSLNKELDFLVRNTFCGFAVIFICNLILFISLGNYQFSKLCSLDWSYTGIEAVLFTHKNIQLTFAFSSLEILNIVPPDLFDQISFFQNAEI